MEGENLNKKNFDEKLKAESEDFQLKPSEGVWENIQKEIPSAGRKVYYMKWAAAAAVLLLLIGMGIYFLNENNGFFSSSNQKSGDIVKNSTPPRDVGSVGDSLQQKDRTEMTKIPSGDKKIKGEKAEKTPLSTSSKKSELAQTNSLSPTGNNKKKVARLSTKSVQEQKTYPEKQNKKANKKEIPTLAFLQGKVPFETPKVKEYSMPIQYPDDFIEQQFKTNFKEPLWVVNKPEKHVHRQKVTFGAHFTPGVSYRKLKPSASPGGPMTMASPQYSSFQALDRRSTQNTISQENGSSPNVQHHSNWGWNAGLRMGIPLSDKWIVKTGVSLQETGYKIDAYRVVVADRLDNRQQLFSTAPRSEPSVSSALARLDNSETNLPQNKEVGLKNQYLNMGIPVLIGYNFGNKEKMNLTVMAGAGLTYMLNSTTVEYTPEMDQYLTHSKKDYLKPFNSNLLFEMDLNVPISEKMNISVGPTLQYQLTSSYKSEEPVVEFPYLIGFKTALFWR